MAQQKIYKNSKQQEWYRLQEYLITHQKRSHKEMEETINNKLETEREIIKQKDKIKKKIEMQKNR